MLFALVITAVCSAILEYFRPGLLTALLNNLLSLLLPAPVSSLIEPIAFVTSEPTVEAQRPYAPTATNSRPVYRHTPSTDNRPSFTQASPTFRDYSSRDFTLGKKNYVTNYTPVQDPIAFQYEPYRRPSFSTSTASTLPPYHSPVPSYYSKFVRAELPNTTSK
ncbi:hypothetical protein FRB95_004243 [Tulasnella sp. JGI-2019a]|nr:hypothetical protein FRB93_011493 [Tulasnella sp. JGI-2019a]KAG9030194.1 hypothetical protein FRB95_004243 [Tulasnella sp. JGI-2019a]